MKKVLALVLAVSMLIGLAACSAPKDANTGNTTTNTTTAAPEQTDANSDGIVRGGILKIATATECGNLLWTGSGGGPSDLIPYWCNYETLFNYNDKGGIDPWLATGYEPHPDDLYYLITLRQGVKFSDGSDLNAEVAKWNIEHYIKVGSKKSLVQEVVSVDVVDDYTIKVNLSSWNACIPYAFGREPGIMFSQKQFETYGEEYCTEHPVGTGPFKLVEFTRDVVKKYEKNEYYWNGEVYLDGVEMYVYGDAVVAQAAIENGEIDVWYGATYNQASQMKAKGWNVECGTVAAQIPMVVFDSADPSDPLSNVKVRQAISHAINKEAIVNAVYYGMADVTNQFCVGSYYFDKNVKGYEYDLEKAKQLMAEAGYPDGFDTTILVTTSNQATKDGATIVAEQLKDIGINVTIDARDSTAYSAQMTGWGKGLIYHTSGCSISVPMQVSSMFRQGLSGNVIGLDSIYRSDNLEAALKGAMEARNDEDQLKAFNKAAEIMIDEECLLSPVCTIFFPFIKSDKLHDDNINTGYYQVNTLAKAWLSK